MGVETTLSQLGSTFTLVENSWNDPVLKIPIPSGYVEGEVCGSQ